MNTTVIMVSFKSEALVLKNIKSFPKNTNIIIIENSQNNLFKKKIETQHKNTFVILNQNNGFGQAANLGAKLATTKYLLFCSPDNFVDHNAIKNLEILSKEIMDDFGLLVLSEINEDIKERIEIYKPTGIICFFAIRKNFLQLGGFDERFFLYYEDNDLVKRFLQNKKKIFKVSIKYKNFQGSHNKEFNYPIEVNRNWHLMWSKFYYLKKHHNYFYALLVTLPAFFRSLFRILFFLSSTKTKAFYLARAGGLYNAYRLKSSWYRPIINKKK